MSKIKIGFVIAKYGDLQSKFTNGLSQNTHYLVSLFRSVPEYDVSYVLVVDNCLDESLQKQQELGDDTPLVELKSLDPQLSSPITYDVLIHMEAYIPEALIQALKTSFSTKFVTFLAGNTMWGFMEAIICDRQANALPAYAPNIMDDLWISPHYAYQKTFLETLTKSPVTIIPYIYEPWFLQKLEKLRRLNNPEFNPYYTPSLSKHIGILEPNINLTKTAIIPACIVESLYCTDARILEEKHIHIYGSIHLLENQAFQQLFYFFKSKSLFSANPRFPVVDILNKNCNLIISHQHVNALNYLYLDALYYNIPLVHNSDMFKDYGYYYPDFDIRQGAEALRSALVNHDSRLEEYSELAKQALYQFSISNNKNINRYKNIIDSLLAR